MATSTPITGDQADLECMKAHPYFRYSHKGGSMWMCWVFREQGS